MWYSVLIARALSGVRVAVLPLQVTPDAGTRISRPLLFSVLSRNEPVVIELHFIAALKTAVIEVLTGTLTASSVGFIDSTSSRDEFAAAAAGPTVPTITTNATSEIVLTTFLSIIVPLLVDDMAFISSLICYR